MNKIVWLIFCLLFFSLNACLDNVKSPDVSFYIRIGGPGGEKQVGNFSVQKGENLQFIMKTDADKCSVWPGIKNKSYDDYGKEGAEGVALTQNKQHNFTASFAYDTVGTFAMKVIAIKYNIKSTKFRKSVMTKKIVISKK